MTELTVRKPLHDPWLVAVWPGMGHVALAAGYYLLARLDMYMLTELSSRELFDIEQVEVKGGIIRPGHLPRSRLFVWHDPAERHDILLLIGEQQPPLGKLAFCHWLMDYARELGVTRVFTFAAMVTRMDPEKESRVFGVTTDEPGLAEFRQLELSLLEDGHISGLNGILLGVASEAGLRGTGLLGEVPHMFSQVSYPKASLAVLRVFTTIAGIEIDFSELVDQVKSLDKYVGRLLSQVRDSMARQTEAEEETYAPEPSDENRLSQADADMIEQLFREAEQDRSKAWELKNELDRLGVFREFEDRFLDLFRR